MIIKVSVVLSSLFIVTVSQCFNNRIVGQVSGSASEQCPSSPNEISVTPSVTEAVQAYIECTNAICASTCRSDPSWMRVGYLDMTDSSHSCPSAWQLTTSSGVRACGRKSSSSSGCGSVLYSANGKRYSKVCGRIIGYQYYSNNGFVWTTPSSNTVDGIYVDGVSLTHGLPGSRTHVWSFASAWYETAGDVHTCPCMVSNSSAWNHTIQSFVGNNYFCAAGSHNRPSASLYTSNPLWDGEGCTGDNTCCQFNQPPWFCTTLPSPTGDDLEVRICSDQATSNENVFLSNIDLYVK